ncbi:kelch repeat and BTB domain-containing protein 13 isoform X2 [Mugil cephalus]|uniref:kelch repeat and BTB domain-containing protein 13 isoform X2 n=1 Tax=Mugil cephalus TaxID=48193 RepID=UPI001FB76D24|nr:kelch repeat and BTB domain-containing protein 13 isoform X2 [Mugil cephalus]
MNTVGKYFMILFKWMYLCMKYGLTKLLGAIPFINNWLASSGVTDRESCSADSEGWETYEALRTYYVGDGTKVTVQTSTHAFHVDLQRLSECSEYFRALSQSRMREISDSHIHLDHVSSPIFYNFLEFSFNDNFKVPQVELEAHIQELLCAEMKMTVFAYLSRNLLELPQVIGCLGDEEKEEVVQLRMQGDRRLCSLRKENLSSWKDPETERSRRVFTLKGSEDSGDWQPVTELPFRADKWCFTTVVLFNYLYVIGGYRQRMKRGWEFNMASFRYNPSTHTWVATSPMIKHRRHFSAVACEGCIYAVGGWYLDSLVTPDSSTALYAAVECYDPWEDTWRFVSSLPLTDFQFTVSLSHDVPLVTSLGHFVYVLGTIQRTGEKLLLQYNTKLDSWSELLPTLTRADIDLPTLYFLGATDRLLVIGGNNSENVVTSFCVETQKWGQVHRAEKVAFAGQGTVVGDQLLMPSIEHNTVVRMDLRTLTLTVLPPLPISICYEAAFYLHF